MKLMIKLMSAILVCAGVISAMETFNLNSPTASGNNWTFDANHHYFCDGDATNGHGNCPASPRKDVPTLFVNNGANLRITGSSTTIRVQVSGNAQITLDNASIVRTGHSVLRNEPKDGQPKHYITISPMQLVGNANLTLTLVGDNTLAMGDGTSSLDRWSAGLGVPDGTTLTIGGNGKLTAIGGISAAGIGGHQGGVPGTHFGRPAGNITINSGTIIATGRELASGIGNGSNMQGGTITINGGDITARGGSTRVAAGPNGGAAGIGGGGSASAVGYAAWCKPSVININGGVVRAFGGGGSAGIGGASGGLNDNAVNITINITGGEITATGGNDIMSGGAGIGGGKHVGGGNINITGGTINAVGGYEDRSGVLNPALGFGAGIGAGGGTSTGTNNLTLNGNAVVFASSLTNASNVATNTTNTRGILFNGNTGTFHGTSVEPTNNFTIPSGRTLTIQSGRTLTIASGITMTNNGTVTNNGTIVRCGTITGTIDGTLPTTEGCGEPEPTPPTITTTTLPNATVGTAYSQTLAATGDAPITWSISNGTLPVGLNLNTSTGAITGTPTTAGTANFTVQATNTAGNTPRQLSIVVNASGGGGGGGDNTNFLSGEWIWSENYETGRWSRDIWGNASLDEIFTEEGKVVVPEMWVGMNDGFVPTGGVNLVLNLADGNGVNFVTIGKDQKIIISYKSDYRLFLILEPKTPPAGEQGWTRWHAMLPAGVHNNVILDFSKIGGKWAENDWQNTEVYTGSGNHFRLHSWGADQPAINLETNLKAFYFQVPSDGDTEGGNSTSLEITKFAVTDGGGGTSIVNVERSSNRYGIRLAQNPVSDRAEIGIVLPDNAQIAQANIAIFDMTGNVVWTDRIANEGRLSRWDLRNSAGRFVANGTYLVIAEVRDRNGKMHRYSARLGVNR